MSKTTDWVIDKMNQESAAAMLRDVVRIEAEPMPLLLVLSIDAVIGGDEMDKIRKSCERLRANDARLPQMVVLQRGMTLEAVLDPRQQAPVVMV